MLKKVLASFLSAALIISAAAVSVSAADSEKVLLGTEVTVGAWGEAGNFVEGTDFTFDELISYENLEVSFKFAQDAIDEAGSANSWHFSQSFKFYSKSWTDPFLYNEGIDRKDINSEGAMAGVASVTAGEVNTVRIAVADIIADFEASIAESPIYNASAHSTAEYFDALTFQAGHLTITITSIKLVDPVTASETTTSETTETEVTTTTEASETEETTTSAPSETDETTTTTASETNETPDTGAVLTLTAIPALTLAAAVISRKRK